MSIIEHGSTMPTWAREYVAKYQAMIDEDIRIITEKVASGEIRAEDARAEFDARCDGPKKAIVSLFRTCLLPHVIIDRSVT